jgi:hypothetical protein
MPAVVTFDPLTLRIIEISAAGDNILNLDEIYSEWKVFVKTGDNAKHPQAFRFVGGDQTEASSFLGVTYFLLNGWRIRPAELSHKLTVEGNLRTDPFGSSAFVDTLGSFTVSVETEFSNLSEVEGLGTVTTDSVLSRKILQNRLETNPSTGVLTVYDDDDSVLLTGNISEDVAEVQAYRGQGSERRNRLT